MYSFSIEVKGDLSSIEEKIVASLADEGFGVLTEIDVQATLRKKLGLERPPYKILGACNTDLANQAIEANLKTYCRHRCRYPAGRIGVPGCRR